MSPELFQDFMDGYINFFRVSPIISLISGSYQRISYSAGFQSGRPLFNPTGSQFWVLTLWNLCSESVRAQLICLFYCWYLVYYSWVFPIGKFSIEVKYYMKNFQKLNQKKKKEKEEKKKKKLSDRLFKILFSQWLLYLHKKQPLKFRSIR